MTARVGDIAWTAAVILIAVLLTAAAFGIPSLADALIADARIADGQVWRALTGPLLHATWGHLIRDLALIAIAGFAYEAHFLGRRALLSICGLALPAIAVLAAGHADWYCGTSGLSHAWIAAALTYELRFRTGGAHAFVGALCVLGAGKLAYELASGAPAFPMALGDSIVQVPLAHAIGALVGVACTVSHSVMNWKAPQSQPT